MGLLSPSWPAFGQNPSPRHETPSSAREAPTSFGVLKGLAGKWSGTVTTEPHNPEIEGPIQVTMRVASAGSALVHEMAPGGVPEPTLIYVEGNRLTLVHYCEAGNRPRLVARPPTDAKTVAFDFVDISGDKNPTYLQQLVFTILGAEHHTEDWTFVLPEDKQLHARFDLKRAAENTPAPTGR
jgi:hypothetical protein